MLARALAASEADGCLAAGFIARHARGEVGRDLALEVELDFVVDFGARSPGEKEAEARKPFAQHTDLLLNVLEDQVDGAGEAGPVVQFRFEAPAACGRERIKARLAIVLRGSPLGANPALVFQAVECRIERSLADLEHVRRKPARCAARWPSRAAARRRWP